MAGETTEPEAGRDFPEREVGLMPQHDDFLLLRRKRFDAGREAFLQVALVQGLVERDLVRGQAVPVAFFFVVVAHIPEDQTG